MTNIEKLHRIVEILGGKIAALSDLPAPDCSAEWLYRKTKREQLLEDLKTVESIIEEK